LSENIPNSKNAVFATVKDFNILVLPPFSMFLLVFYALRALARASFNEPSSACNSFCNISPASSSAFWRFWSPVGGAAALLGSPLGGGGGGAVVLDLRGSGVGSLVPFICTVWVRILWWF
jgi:hypothetical protein